MRRLAPLVALALGLAAVGCGRARTGGQPAVADAGVAGALRTDGVIRAQTAALRALTESRRPAARRAVRRMSQALLALERDARRACRGRGFARLQPDAERRHACQALQGLVAVNNEAYRALDPQAPTAELLDGLDRISAMASQVLGVDLGQSGLARLPKPVVPATELDLLAKRGGRVRGAQSYRTCLAKGLHPVLGRSQAAVSHTLSRVGGSAVLAWRRDCAAAQPRCKADTVVVQRLSAEGSARGSPVDTGVDVTDWGLGEPFAIRDAPGGAMLLFGSDADQLLQRLGPKLRPRGRPRVAWVHARQLVAGRFVTRPGPAWVSVADQGHRISVRRFDPTLRRPLSRLRLLPTDEVSGAFGAPALKGDADGYAVAWTTLQHLHFARLDPQGSPRGPAQQVVLGRGFFDPQCTVIARHKKRYLTLTVGTRVDRSGTAMLVAFDRQGRYAGLAVELELPVRVDRRAHGGCPVWLLPMKRHLVVITLEATVRGVAGQRLLATEFKRDGQAAARPVALAQVYEIGGVVTTEEGFLASWTTPPPASTPPGAPQAVSVGHWRCR